MLAAKFQKVWGRGACAFKLDVNVTLPAKGVTGIFGPSGCGKTSMIRCIAGLDVADTGSIMFNETLWQQDNRVVPSYQRHIGYVFQENSLLDHLSVQSNLDFAMQRVATRSATRVREIVELLDIGQLMSHHPGHLSVGQQQRVAIACAVLSQPALLIMDEPLASLDHARKMRILAYLKALTGSIQFPILYVSHALEEIAFLAEEVVYLEHGRIHQQGTLQQVLSQLGQAPFEEHQLGGVISGQVCARQSRWSLVQVCMGVTARLWINDNGEQKGETVHIHIPAHQVGIALKPPQDSSYLNVLAAEVMALNDDHQTSFCNVILRVAEQTLYARISRLSAHNLKLEPGLQVFALIKSASVLR